MRRPARALATLLAAIALVVSGCSDDDASDTDRAAAERSTTTTSVTTSTTSTTSTTLAPTTDPATQSTRPPGTTRPPAPTTTRPTCLATVPTSTPPVPTFGLDPADQTPAAVTIGNQHSATAVVVVRGQSHTLAPGATQSLSLAPTHQRETVAAWPASNPADRFSYDTELIAGGRHDLAVSTMPTGTCDGDVHRALFLRQTGFST